MALPDTLRADATAGAAVAVVLVLLGAPMGLLWATLAPHAQVRIAGPDNGSYLDPEPRAFLGADLSFLLIGLVLGLVAGLVAWRVASRRAPGVVLGLALGGLLAAWIAARTGVRVGRSEFRAALSAGTPAVVGQSLALRAEQCLVGLPLGALTSFVVLFWLHQQPVAAAGAEQAEQSVQPDQRPTATATKDVWATP